MWWWTWSSGMDFSLLVFWVLLWFWFFVGFYFIKFRKSFINSITGQPLTQLTVMLHSEWSKVCKLSLTSPLRLWFLVQGIKTNKKPPVFCILFPCLCLKCIQKNSFQWSWHKVLYNNMKNGCLTLCNSSKWRKASKFLS